MRANGNLDVIIGCSMSTSSEDAWKRAPGQVVHRGLARPTIERISKESRACSRIWWLWVKSYSKIYEREKR